MKLRVFQHDQVESTNSLVLDQLEAGAAQHGDVHVAQTQTAGRGRLGRSWASLDGGLYLSVALAPGRGAPPAVWTAAGGLAVLDAVRDCGLRTATLDWPNDVEVGGAKLAGILVESRGFDPDRPRLALGIGLNVEQSEFPAELTAERAVTSLRLADCDSDRWEALAMLLGRLPARLNQALEDVDALSAEFLAGLQLENAEVAVDAGEPVNGRLVGLHLEHGLRLAQESGEERALAIEHVRAVTRRASS